MKPVTNMEGHHHLVVEVEILHDQLSLEVDRRLLQEIQYKLNTWFGFGRNIRISNFSVWRNPNETSQSST